jgi:hypothetical protein
MMKNYIKILLRESLLKEGLDRALDNLLNSGSFDKLSEVDKVILLAPSGDIEKLKQIDLVKFYKDNGNSFGDFELKVRVKDINEQPIQQRYSIENAGKIGYVHPYLKRNPENNVYFTYIRLEEGEDDSNQFGGEFHEDVLILLDNMYPLAYGDVHEEFAKFMHRRKYELNQFRDDSDLPDEFRNTI